MNGLLNSNRSTRLLFGGVALLIIAAAFLAGVVGSGEFGNLFGRGGYKKGYDDGYKAAHQKLLQSPLGAALSAGHIASLTGTVSKIDGDKITFTVAQTVLDPLADPAPTERNVTLRTSTAITMQTSRPAAEFAALIADYQKKFAAFQKKSKPGDKPPVAPLPYAEKTGTLADIKVGDKIQVFGAAGTDLTLPTEITTPTRIIKQVQPPTGAGP